MCARDIGLDEDKFKQLISDENTIKLVEKDLKLSREWGITAVPSLVLNERYLISGAQKKEYLKQQLLKVVNEEDIL
jgi:predicted DsbA family dithiol-disulfide isomerase